MKKIILLLTGLVIFCIQNQAQSTMYMKEKTETDTAFALNSIKKLTFPTGNMQVIMNNGTINTYSLNNLQYFNFTDFQTSISQISNDVTKDILLFPNPVINELQISIQSAEKGLLQISIIDIQGKIIQEQITNSQMGMNIFTINVTQLPYGLYVCRMQNENKVKTVKFIKN